MISKPKKIILAGMMSLLAWSIANILIIEIAFWQFFLIEILIAVFQVITKLALNKAEGKPLLSDRENDYIQPPKKTGE
jgi:hypothetical protein